MIWRSFVDTEHNAVHVTPDNSFHEHVDCWCKPTEEIMDPDGMVLVTHKDGSDDEA